MRHDSLDRRHTLGSFELYTIPKVLYTGEVVSQKLDIVSWKVQELDFRADLAKGYKVESSSIGAAWITDSTCLVGGKSIQDSRKPMYVYLRTELTRVNTKTNSRRKIHGIRRYIIRTEMGERGSSGKKGEEACEYRLDGSDTFMQTLSKGDTWFRILPGCQRSIILNCPDNVMSDAAPILKAYRIIDQEYLLPRGHNIRLGGIHGYLDVPFNFGNVKWKGMAWDDTSGRLCIAKEGDSNLLVVSFAKAPIAGKSHVVLLSVNI